MSRQDLANSEKDATSQTGQIPPAVPRTWKARSCFVCRQRKVRCDKQSPCGNCRRANIPCVLPSAERRPRWTRRQDLLANNAVAASRSVEHGETDLMERLRYLEGLVKDLSDQLQQARSAYGSSAGQTPESTTQSHDEAPTEGDVLRSQFGRMVVQDSGETRYVSSGFWSRVDDELEGLNINADSFLDVETGSSDDEARSRHSTPVEGHRSSWTQHSFLFPGRPVSSDLTLQDYHPLPSQVPFLIEMFAENVYPLLAIVHLPSVRKVVHDMRTGGSTAVTTSDEALLFSIYFSTIVSMEEDEVMTNFGQSKCNLGRRYCSGLESALVKADFLNSPDLTLLSAFTIFVYLARRHNSPRYVWMMTSLVVRVAQFLGLQRDGSSFKHLTPFEVEMRRRVWWVVVLLDIRASEDQGTDLIIKQGSFDTRLPSNINDGDIDPNTQESPAERTEFTDVSFLRAAAGMGQVSIEMMAVSTGGNAADHKELDRLLHQVQEKYDQEFFQYQSNSDNISYWTSVRVVRIVTGKLALLAYLPILFSSSLSEKESLDIRQRLLIYAIEVAEDNHELSAEKACRHRRWIWQIQTHWYAIVFLLIETSRRQWTPSIERAWAALQSEWLYPRRSSISRNLRIWVPLRSLMHKARKHREDEVRRLRADYQAALNLELEDRHMPKPSSSGQYPNDSSAVDMFRQRWWHLVIPENDNKILTGSNTTSAGRFTNQSRDSQASSTASRASYLVSEDQEPLVHSQTETVGEKNALEGITPSFNQPASTWPDFANWMWADSDTSLDVFPNPDLDADLLHPSIDLDNGMDWLAWLESAKTIE